MPGRLVVLGGGVAGSELSQAYARLGAEVTAAGPEPGARLVPRAGGRARRRPSPPAPAAVLALRQAGVATRMVGAGALQVSPAFVMTDEQVGALAAAFREALDALQ
ncbi:NAD-binding protein [Georgenia sp. SUBG003]|uniref:NAD-binding protein n=1 Tax=Georgenia sp. SUBG003 TaxID=1497974 RepID=UPI003AB444BD